MREIIYVHLGQCGSQIGLKYWDSITQEHGLDPTGTYIGDSDLQLQGINVSFNEVGDKRYAPRAVFVDTDPQSSDLILQSSLGKMFNAESMAKGQEGSGNNYGRAMYTDGAEVGAEMIELVRKEAEKCESLQGIQMTHAMGGGTGSAFSFKLFEDSPVDSLIHVYSVFPSEEICDSPVEIYNVVLAFQELYFNPEMVHVLDNAALYNVASRNLVSRTPSYDDINGIVGAAMTGVTSAFRFSGTVNSSMRKLTANLMFYRRMHFCMLEYAPLAHGLRYNRDLSAAEFVQELFEGRNVLCSVNSKNGRYYTTATMFRGDICVGEAEDELAKVQKQSERFVKYMKDNTHASYCDVAPIGVKTAATMVSNSTAIVEVFKKMQKRYETLWKKRAYAHWYYSEGMDEMEFQYAESKLSDCMIEHAQWSGFQDSDQEDNEEYYENEGF